MCAMTRPLPPIDTLYPESDGQPMGETPLHRDEMNELIFRLRRHYAADPSAYVSGNMMMYYEPGRPAATFSPDVFVALGAGDGPRRVYKIWEEACPPTVVFEVSSRSTVREDRARKRELCERLGVAECWLYDPEDEGPGPPLAGWRLRGRRYAPITPEPDGSFASTPLRLRLRVAARRLELEDEAGRRLPRITDVEAERAAAETARAAAEIEVARLRAELARLRGEGAS